MGASANYLPQTASESLILLIRNSLQITTRQINWASGVAEGRENKGFIGLLSLFTKKCSAVKDKGKTIVTAPENEQIKVIIVEKC